MSNQEDARCRMCGTIWLINEKTGCCVTCEMVHFLDEEEEPEPTDDREDELEMRDIVEKAAASLPPGGGLIWVWEGEKRMLWGTGEECD